MIYGSFTTSELIEEVKKRAFLPDSQNTLTDDDIVGFINTEMYDKVTTSDLMNNPPFTANINDQPDILMKKFEEYAVWNIPVIDDEGIYLGFISKTGMLDKYREKLIHSEDVKL